MKLTTVQWLGILIGILGVLTAGGTQLDVLIGATATKSVIAGCTLLMAALGVVMTTLTGQVNALKAVQAMPGVESIVVNKQANSALAQLAIDPAQAKIEVKPGAEAAISRAATGA